MSKQDTRPSYQYPDENRSAAMSYDNQDKNSNDEERCKKYNKGERRRSDCPYLHSCSICVCDNHPAIECRSKDAQQAANAAPAPWSSTPQAGKGFKTQAKCKGGKDSKGGKGSKGGKSGK